MAEWLAAWQGHYPPRADRTVVAVFAGNHGVVAQGVAAYPAAVTEQMVANFQAGGAAVNQICKTFDLGLKVFELALEKPTRDITQDAAMEEADCAATMAYGMEAIEAAATCCASAKWASATPRLLRPSPWALWRRRRRTGWGRAPAWMRRGLQAQGLRRAPRRGTASRPSR